jgi:hypothetical protein
VRRLRTPRNYAAVWMSSMPVYIVKRELNSSLGDGSDGRPNYDELNVGRELDFTDRVH